MKFDTLYYFFSIEKVFIKQYYRVFWKLLKEVAPVLYQELTKPEEIVSCNVFLFGWVITLFA